MTKLPHKINSIYDIVVKVLNQENHQDHFHTKMPSNQVLTLAIYAMMVNNGNYTRTLSEFEEGLYFPCILEKSRFGRRLSELIDYIPIIILAISDKSRESIKSKPDYNLIQNTFAVDTKPMPICDNIRIGSCRLTDNHKRKDWVLTQNDKYRRGTDDNYRGFVASKQSYYYGFKLNMMVDIIGVPRTYSLHPAAMGDLETLSHLHFDLPYGSELLADKIYNSSETELALLSEGIILKPIKKSNSKCDKNYFEQLAIRGLRKVVETSFSMLGDLVSRLRCTSLVGAIIKCHLTVLAFAFYQGFRIGFL